MKISGIIQKKQITSGETEGKTWQRCSYTINNHSYSTFDTKLMEFNEGDEVEIEYESKGNYNNIINITKKSKKIKKYIITIEEV